MEALSLNPLKTNAPQHFCHFFVFPLRISTYSSWNQSNIFYVQALCDIIRYSGGELESGIQAKDLSRLGGKEIQHESDREMKTKQMKKKMRDSMKQIPSLNAM